MCPVPFRKQLNYVVLSTTKVATIIRPGIKVRKLFGYMSALRSKGVPLTLSNECSSKEFHTRNKQQLIALSIDSFGLLGLEKGRLQHTTIL